MNKENKEHVAKMSLGDTLGPRKGVACVYTALGRLVRQVIETWGLGHLVCRVLELIEAKRDGERVDSMRNK